MWPFRLLLIHVCISNTPKGDLEQSRVQSSEGKGGFLLLPMDDGKGSGRSGFILRDDKKMCGCCHKQCFDFCDRDF